MKHLCNTLKYSILTLTLAASVLTVRGVDNTQLDLAAEKLRSYDIDGAREHVDKFLKQGGRKAKPTAAMTAEADAMSERIDRVEMMLNRVEHIEVVDSLIVSRDDFFTHYRLSPGAGSLFDTRSLPEELGSSASGIGYKSPDGRKIIWAQPDSTATTSLVESSALTDGSWERPTPLPGLSAQEAAYPFMMTDGATLYYAADGEGSLGGLDIWLTRYDGERWLEPQNIGMPYNSPYDDYMMAIDETTGAGWWATDRNQLGDSITIYMFRPNEIRENYPDDTPDIASKAMLTSIRDTWRDPQGVADFLKKLNSASHGHRGDTTAEPEFTLSLGNGRIYTQLDDFRSPIAREAMEDYLILEDEIRIDRIDLDNLRQQYAQGDPSCGPDILQLEEKIRANRHQLLDLRNRIITIENRK